MESGSNKIELVPGIVVYSNVIPNSDKLYEEIENDMVLAKIKWMPARVKSGSEISIEYKTRDTDTIGVPYEGSIKDIVIEDSPSRKLMIKLNNMFFENFDPLEKDYMNMYGVGSEWHDTYGILKYGPGQQFTNHIDDNPTYHRRISTVYYLNENYTGGEINFPRFNITIKPKANQMIIFPSTYVYNHSVSPVIDGYRYAVSSWLR